MRPQAESNFAVRGFFKYKLDSTQSYYIIILTSIIYMALLSLSQHAVIKCFSLHFITAPKFHFVVQSQRLPKRKDSRGFCKRTNKVHKFKGCFLRRREKKKRIFCFQKAQQMCHQAGSRCSLTASCLLILVRKWGIAIKTYRSIFNSE